MASVIVMIAFGFYTDRIHPINHPINQTCPHLSLPDPDVALPVLCEGRDDIAKRLEAAQALHARLSALDTVRED